jgi:FkbM family methyltransferase
MMSDDHDFTRPNTLLDQPSLTSEKLIDGLYAVLLGRPPSESERDYWLDRLLRTASFEAVLLGIARSDEYRRRPLSVAGPNDLICKLQRFPGGAAAYIVLPVHSADPIVESYLNGEPANEYMLEIMAETTKPGDRVLDLGSHVGTFAIGAAAMGRHVTAVDASALHSALLRHSIAINHFESMTVRQAAISEQSGSVRYAGDNLFGAVDFSGAATGTIAVPACGVDRLVEETGGQPVAFIKMDIEGSEIDALRSGRRTLTRDGPLILFESNGTMLGKAGHSVADLRHLFAELGYRVFRIEGERWIHAPPDQVQPEEWVDMLALTDAHQRQWESRIDWDWTPDAILEKCRVWAELPHPNTRLHLLAEMRRHLVDPSIAVAMAEIEQRLARQ